MTILEEVEEIAADCKRRAKEHLDFGLEDIKRYDAANDLTNICFRLEDLAGRIRKAGISL